MKIVKKFVRALEILGGSIVSLLLVGFRSKKTIYFASSFGKVEHRFGRITGIIIAVSFFIEYYKIVSESNLLLYSIATSFVSWLIYLVSHTMEKKLYGKGLRKGGFANPG